MAAGAVVPVGADPPDLFSRVFGVGMALLRNREAVAAMTEAGWEICSHGWRWIHYQQIDETTEREHMRLAVAAIRELTGAPPVGWYTGRDSPNTRRLVVEHGGFLYDYLKDTFDTLYGEGDPEGDNAPKTMSVGLHCRLIRRPGRAAGLSRFLDYVQQHDQVWVTRRRDIARHWIATHPAPPG